MAENKKVVFVGLLLVGMLMGEVAANKMANCYGECYFECILDMRKLIPYVPKKLLPCGWKCLKKCVFHIGKLEDENADVSSTPVSAPLGTSPYDYCNIGCALDTCADSIEDAAKMESCAENCSNGVCKALR